MADQDVPSESRTDSLTHLEKRKLTAEIWNLWIVALSVAIAGLWAAYTFWAQKEVIKVESKQVAMEFDMTVNQIPLLDKTRYGLEVIISVENKGISPVVLDISGSDTMTVARLDERNTANPLCAKAPWNAKSYNVISSNLLSSIPNSTVYPGVKTDLRYFFVLPEPGLHFASFVVPIPEDVLAIMTKRQLGQPIAEEKVENTGVKDAPPAWMATKYFSLKGYGTTLEKQALAAPPADSC